MSIIATLAATAAILATMPNVAGGEISLWSQRGSCPANQSVATTVDRDGRVQLGCWTGAGGKILIEWPGRDIRMHDAMDFILTPEGRAFVDEGEPAPTPAPRPVVPRDPATERSL